MENKTFKALLVDEKVHKIVKVEAAKRGVSMGELIVQLIKAIKTL